MAETHTGHAYYQTLLQAISDRSPCGENLEYDAGFIMLQSKLQPKLDAEYGSFIEAAEPVNWAEIERDSLAMLQRSRDIRLIVALIRCRIRQIGVAALQEGLLILRDLLTAFPADLYPQLTEEGEYDPVMRANALAELEDVDGLLADLRQQPLPRAAGLQIAVKDFEKAHATPREEGALPETTVKALKLEWQEREDPGIASLQKAWLCLTELKASLKESLGEDAPDFVRLELLLRLFVGDEKVISASVSQPLPEPEQASTADNTDVTSGNQTGEIMPITARKEIASRADALLKLQEVRLWFTRMEPSSPAILLLQLTEATIGKSFPQLLKILPADITERLHVDKE